MSASLITSENFVVPSTMRAAVVRAPGEWTVEDVSVPSIAPDEVLIKIEASGLCFTDVHFSERAQLGGSYPMIFGHEPVGTIVAVGSAVRNRRVGDRVGTTTLQRTCERCEWCLSGNDISCPNPTYLFVHRPGSHAQYLAAVASRTTLIPDTLSFEQAAPLFCAGYTVMSGILQAEPRPNDRIAVVGIGGLGHLAIQYAKALGYETIAVTSSADKAALAHELGADRVVSSADDLEAMSIDIVLSTANAYAPALSMMRALRPRGRIVLMGISDAQPLVIPAADVFPGMMVNRWSIIGSQQNERQALELAVQIAAAGKIKVMTQTFSLENVHDAVERVKNGSVRFRAVLVP